MKPSEFLNMLDSHGIYPETALDEFDAEYRACVPLYSHARAAEMIAARGLGGELAEDTGEKLFAGYAAAEALAYEALGRIPPGSRYFGRGSAFRANQAALADAGF